MTATGTGPAGKAEQRESAASSVYRIETEDLGRKVHRTLKEMIINGDLRSGEKLLQDDLAERLGVSRTPLQFAFSKLEQENLVETIPRRGAYVRRYSRKELIDIYDIRSRIEPLAARDVALTARTEDVTLLRQVQEGFDAAAQANDLDALKRTDYAFHMELLRCCGNRFLFDMLANFNIVIISNTRGLLKPVAESCREHHALIAAIEARDPERAERAMFDHVDGARRNLIGSGAYLAEADGPAPARGPV